MENKLRSSSIEILEKMGELIFDFKDMGDVEMWWEKYVNSENAFETEH